MNNRFYSWTRRQLLALGLAGVLAVVLGLVVRFTGFTLPLVPRPDNLPFILYNVGALAVAFALMGADEKKRRQNNPEKARQEAIEAADERNQALHNKAFAKAFDFLALALGVSVPLLALFGFIEKTAFFFLVLVLVAAMAYGGYQRQRLEGLE